MKYISLDLDINTGKITKIDLEIDRTDTSKVLNSIVINKVEIKRSSKNKNNTLSKSEIENIKNNLKEKYSIDINEITINST